MNQKITLSLLLLLVPLLGPGAALAADLTLSGAGEVEYDDNAFRSPSNEEDDVFFRFRPNARIHEDRGQDLLYSLEYEVPFEFAVDHSSELNDIDQLANGRVTYHVNDRLDLFASDNFRYLRGTQRDIEVITEEGSAINQERDRVTTNFAEGGMSYQFSPRLVGTGRVSHELFDIDRDDRADNWMLQASSDLLYALTAKHQLGGGVRYIHQEFDATDTIVGSQLNTYNVFGQWNWEISETTGLTVSVGPSLIDNDQDDSPNNVPTAQVPSVQVGAIADATGLNLLDRDGNLATGPYAAGSRLVAQIDACPTLADGTPVITNGTICPLPQTGLTNPNVTGVLLDAVADADLITQLDQQVILVNDNPGGKSESSVNVFGEVVLTKRWAPNFQSALRYSRTQAGAGGLGGAVIRDTVNLSNVWDFGERWQLVGRADWSLRKTVDEATSVFTQTAQVASPLGGAAFVPELAGVTQLVTVRGADTDVDTMRWGVAGRLIHHFTRNTSGWLQLTYNEQDSKGGTLGNDSDFENFLATVGVRHVFEPIKLW